MTETVLARSPIGVGVNRFISHQPVLAPWSEAALFCTFRLHGAFTPAMEPHTIHSRPTDSTCGDKQASLRAIPMALELQPDDTLLFYGDSITDCGRDRANLASLGGGYVSQINARLGLAAASPALRVINTGISGNRIYDLESRLEADLLAHKPTVVTFLIGINDVWRHFDSKIASPAAEFAAAYRRVLTRIRDELNPQLVLMEPFLQPVPEDRRAWRVELDPKITVVRDLAVEFDADLIPLDGLFAAAATRAPAAFWLPDGVHPSPAGHALITEAWLDNVL